eukprot:m51a1_g6501 hypothetical protein (383) ;mRNA; f:207579-209229
MRTAFVALGIAFVAALVASDSTVVSTGHFRLDIKRNSPPSFTLYLKNRPGDKYRIEMTEMFEALETNNTMRRSPLTVTSFGLVQWNLSDPVKNTEAGTTDFTLTGLGTHLIPLHPSASLSPPFPSSRHSGLTAAGGRAGTYQGKTFSFDTIVFAISVAMHKGESTSKAKSPFIVLKTGLRLINYTWTEPNALGYLAMSYRFFIGQKEYLPPDVSTDSLEAQFGNVYITRGSSPVDAVTAGSPLGVRMWAVPFKSVPVMKSSLWMLYTPCSVVLTTGVCSVVQNEGPTIGFTAYERKTDKSYIAIVVLTVLAAVALAALIVRYVVLKVRRRMAYTNLFNLERAHSKTSLEDLDEAGGASGGRDTMVHREPINEISDQRQLDDD